MISTRNHNQKINNQKITTNMSRQENDSDATKMKKNEEKDNRYLLVKKMYTNVKNDVHQKDP